MKVYRCVLPTLLKRFKKIRDPRNSKTIKHKATVLMLYGILMFVFQMSSRREANRQMTMPMFLENLRLVFPELESIPHQDTLNRLLSGISVDKIGEVLIELIQRFIRNKKFCRYLISQHYPIAVDGSQKLGRDWCGAEQWLERQVQYTDEDGTVGTRPQYYVYVLEASLAFTNGMTIPLTRTSRNQKGLARLRREFKNIKSKNSGPRMMYAWQNYLLVASHVPYHGTIRSTDFWRAQLLR
ncbi:MAG: transposase family protein [Acidobacteriia bacterium]|nr:transposase family protein [Terriglobia bacterium]